MSHYSYLFCGGTSKCQGYCFLMVAISSRHPSTLIELQNWWPCSTRHTYMYTLEFRLDPKNDGLQWVFKRDFLWQDPGQISVVYRHSKPPSIARFLSQRWLRLHHDACACYRLFFSPCTDWGWRLKELYVFWIGKLPLFIMKLQFPMCLVNGNDHVMTWFDSRMRCNDNGIHHCHLLASFFLCWKQLQEISFLPREICPYKFRRGFWGGLKSDMKKIHRAMIFRILEKDPGMLMYYAAHTR